MCFFFSSRRRHTRLQGDWSSDVCSSDLAVERQFQGRAGEPRLQAGAVARQGGDEVADADRAVDALAAPVELPGRGEGTRDRWPGQRKVDIAERLGGVIGGIFVSEHAVLDPDFGE